MPSLEPVNITPVGNELAVAWSDGTESYFPLEWLRRRCPCASCQGEPDVLGNVTVPPTVSYGEKSFSLRALEVVGGYAVQPAWQDGHRTGLYSWKYLRRLHELLRREQSAQQQQ